MTASLDLDARAANWLAELDPALAQLAHALPPVSAGGQWLLHDARWTPGQGCRLAYRSPASAPAPVFLDVTVTPSGWAHRDYRDDDMLPGLASAADPAAVAALLGTLDGEAVEQCWVEPVRYRPASRCVLRYRVRTASRETALFAKVFQAGEFAALSPVITSLADRAGAQALVPEVVALWPQLQAVLVRAVPAAPPRRSSPTPGCRPPSDSLSAAGSDASWPSSTSRVASRRRRGQPPTSSLASPTRWLPPTVPTDASQRTTARFWSCSPSPLLRRRTRSWLTGRSGRARWCSATTAT